MTTSCAMILKMASSATRFGEGFSNTRTENLLPAPGSLSTQILPAG